MRFNDFIISTILLCPTFSATLVEKEYSKLTIPSQLQKPQRDNNVLYEYAAAREDNNEDKDTASKMSSACKQDFYDIHTQADLDDITSQCSDIAGSIVINGYHSPVIDTGELQTVGGDVMVVNASSLVRINLSKMAVIGGTFGLKELTSLTSVNAPHLNTVGVIDWRVLPIMSTVNFESGIVDVNSITISDTSMIGFFGFDVDRLDTLNINNNRFMESISSNLKGISRKLSISANARNAQVDFPKLEFANNITIRDVGSLNIQNIENVNASMELINNNFNIVKFPKLKTIGGTLSLIENYNLRDAEFFAVDDIGGGLMIVNNTNINKINSFPRLSSVGGAIEFEGDFRETSFGKLNLVRGSASIKSTLDSFDCSRWIRGGDQNGTQSSIIRGGKIVCTSAGKQQVVKYDQDGTVVDEEISFLGDSDSNHSKVGHENAASGRGISAPLLALAILAPAIYLFGV
jgi:hypothetical protein